MTSSPTSAVSPMTTPMPWSMKNRRPSRAAGWISTPVIERVTVASTRAGSRPPGRFHSACSPRWAQMACSPGDVSTSSSREFAAGSRAMAPSTSSSARSASLRTRPNGPAYERSSEATRASDPPSPRTSVSGFSAGLGSWSICGAVLMHELLGVIDVQRRSVDETLEEDGGQVALTERGDDDDDRLALVLLALGHLDGGRDGSARADADEQTLLGRGAPGPLHGRLGVEDRRDEVGAEALDLVGAGLAAVEDRGLRRLDGDDLHTGLAGLKDLADTRDRAAGADAGDDDVDLAVGVLPDLLGGGLAVDLGVGLVGELAREHPATLGGDLFGLGDRALHAGGRVGQDELGAEGPQQRAALLAHRLRHRQDDLVAAGCADHGERDAGVAGRRLDDRAARLELAARLGRVDDGDPDAVLDGVGGVVELELGGNGRRRSIRDLVEAHERRVADQLGHVVVDRHCGGPFGCVRRDGLATRIASDNRALLIHIPTRRYPAPSGAHDPGVCRLAGPGVRRSARVHSGTKGS